MKIEFLTFVPALVNPIGSMTIAKFVMNFTVTELQRFCGVNTYTSYVSHFSESHC